MLLSLTLALLACPTQEATVRVTDVALLSKGELLVAHQDGLLTVLDPAQGAARSGQASEAARGEVFAVHPAAVVHLAVDPRGELVAASSRDGRVALWEVRNIRRDASVTYPGRSATPLAVLHPTPEAWTGAVRVAWTGDGGHLLTWSTIDGPHRTPPTDVQLWSRSGELVWTGPRARWAAASPTEDLVAAVREDELILVRPGHDPEVLPLPGALQAVAFSPDGKRIAIGGRACHLWILDVATRAVLVDKQAEVDIFQDSKFVTRARWSPDGKWVGITCGKGLIPAVIDASSGAVAWTGGFHGGQMWRVFDLSWTPDNRIVTGMWEAYCVDPTVGTRTKLMGAELATLVPVSADEVILLDVYGRLERMRLGIHETGH